MSLATEIAPHLPYLRRYARALVGGQAGGDAGVRAVLEAVIADPSLFPTGVDARSALYRLFHARALKGAGGAPALAPSAKERAALTRLSPLPPRARQALLLTAMEGFAHEDAAYILGVEGGEIAALVGAALDDIDRSLRTRVLIIEDEPIIALDIEEIVRGLGHDIIGVATTRDEALDMARAEIPGLIFADIQLADDSSGIDAVTDILGLFSVPVIFVTAFPERLLTGERPEPTFMITKPFQRPTVEASIAQALFFGSTA